MDRSCPESRAVEAGEGAKESCTEKETTSEQRLDGRAGIRCKDIGSEVGKVFQTEEQQEQNPASREGVTSCGIFRKCSEAGGPSTQGGTEDQELRALHAPHAMSARRTCLGTPS